MHGDRRERLDLVFIQREIHAVGVDMINLCDRDGDILAIPEMALTQDDMGDPVVRWVDHKLLHLADMPVRRMHVRAAMDRQLTRGSILVVDAIP